jgi:four helix bundle protein
MSADSEVIPMGGSYRDLKVWQRSMELTREIYRRTQDFPSQEVYGLTDQMRRAAVSISNNIAEGRGRSSDRDFALFLSHERGALHELETQTLIARDLGYLEAEAAESVETLTTETAKMLNGLIAAMRAKVKDERSDLVTPKPRRD